jgi:YegS/Rv2252/BmrU family lipid kinase
MHAAELTRKALREGHDLIIAVGGDGTVNEVVNGFFEETRPGDAPRAINPDAALAILPRGTGGDFRRSLGLMGDLKASASRLQGTPKTIDVGRVELIGDNGETHARYFINVAEVGLGGDVVRIANTSSKALGGKATFALASARALWGWKDHPVRVSVDGKPAQDMKVTDLSVCNGRFFGGGMLVAPGAAMDDGLFHLTIWSGFTLTDFVVKSGGLYDGSHINFAGTRIDSGKQVRVEPADAAREVLVEADGELLGKLPATFTVVPASLKLVH